MTQYAFDHNGQPVDFNLADRGLAYGDGFFETLRVHQGKVPLWTWHRERLLRSSQQLHLKIDMAVIETLLNQLIPQATVIKLIVSRGAQGYGYRPEDINTTRYYWQIKPDRAYRPVQLGLLNYALSQPARPLRMLKHLNRLDYVQAAITAQQDSMLAQAFVDQDWDTEIGLINQQGCLADALHSNLLWVTGDQYYTTCLDQGGVAGVMLAAWQAQHSVQVTRISACHWPLAKLQAVYLTNAIMGVVPVSQLLTPNGVVLITEPEQLRQKRLDTLMSLNVPDYDSLQAAI